MAVSTSFATFLLEQLNPLGSIEIRRMFGGAGMFANGLMFAIIDGEQLFFKVDDGSVGRYRDEGMGPFTYGTKAGEKAIGGYWRCPDRLFDETDELQGWAREAILVANRSAAAKAKSQNPREAPRKKTRKPSKVPRSVKF